MNYPRAICLFLVLAWLVIPAFTESSQEPTSLRSGSYEPLQKGGDTTPWTTVEPWKTGDGLSILGTDPVPAVSGLSHMAL